MKKKILSLVLALSMVFSLAFALVSCGGNDDDGAVVTTVENAEAWSAAFDADTLATAAVTITFSGSGDGNSISISSTTETTANSIYSDLEFSLSYAGQGSRTTKVEANITDIALAGILSSGFGEGDTLARYGLTVESLAKWADLFDKATYADGKYTIKGNFSASGETFDPNGNDTCVLEFANGKLAKLSLSATMDGDTTTASFAFSKYGSVSAKPISDTVKTAYANAKAAVTDDVTAAFEGMMGLPGESVNIADVKAVLAKFTEVKNYANSSNSSSFTGAVISEDHDQTMIYFNAEGETLTLNGAAVPCKVLGVLIDNETGIIEQLYFMTASAMVEGSMKIVDLSYNG